MSAVGARTAREATTDGIVSVHRIRRLWWHRAHCALLLLPSLPAAAEAWAAPDDSLLRHDAQLLNDTGATNLLLTTCPLRRAVAVRRSDRGCARWALSIGGSIGAWWHRTYLEISNFRCRPDGDSPVYSVGSTLVQSGGRTWNLAARYMEINRPGASNASHIISGIRDVGDIQLGDDRVAPIGRFRIGIGFSNVESTATGQSSTDLSGFLQLILE